jgi:hypothetical protein
MNGPVDRPSSSSRPSLLRSTFFTGLLALLCLCFPGTVLATVLPEKITENMTLTAAGSPYTGGVVKIEAGATVKAEPGAVVKVSYLEVFGTLAAEGTAEAPVAFKPGSELGRWNGIIFKPGSGASALDHTEVVRAGEVFGKAIEIKEASPRITNSLIRESTYYGIFTRVGSPEIAHDTISGCAEMGAYFHGEEKKTLEINFHDNVVEGCGGSAAVYVEPSGNLVATSLGNNVIRKNSALQGIYYNGGPYEAEIPPDSQKIGDLGSARRPALRRRDVPDRKRRDADPKAGCRDPQRSDRSPWHSQSRRHRRSAGRLSPSQ